MISYTVQADLTKSGVHIHGSPSHQAYLDTTLAYVSD